MHWTIIGVVLLKKLSIIVVIVPFDTFIAPCNLYSNKDVDTVFLLEKVCRYSFIPAKVTSGHIIGLIFWALMLQHAWIPYKITLNEDLQKLAC